MRKLLRRPEAALFALVLASYAYFYQAGGWNQNSRFDLTRALVEEGTARIDDFHKNTGDKAKKDGHYYCDKAPGVSWLAVPAYAVTRLFAPEDRKGVAHEAYLAGAAHASTVFAIALPSALSVVALALLLGALGVGDRARVVVAAGYGLATLAFPYSTLLYGHQLAASLTLGAFALLVLRRDRAGVAALAGAGALLGLAVAVEYPSALAALAIGGYAASFVRPWQRLGWLAAGAAVPGLAVALYHAVAFGGPFALPYDFSTQPHRSMGFFMGLGVPDLAALWHILLSPYRGLFFSAPWLALAIPGAVRLVRRARAEAMTCIAIVLVHVWLNASLVDWQGGWAMGARYLVPCLPFLVVLVAGLALPLAAPRRAVERAGWAVGVAAALYAAFLMLAGTAVKPEVPVVEKRPFSGYILPRFGRGELAVSKQSIDSIGNGASLGRLDARHMRFAYNLGQRAGLDGRVSLLPLGVAWIACGAWAVWALRLRARGDSPKMQAS